MAFLKRLGGLLGRGPKSTEQAQPAKPRAGEGIAPRPTSHREVVIRDFGVHHGLPLNDLQTIELQAPAHKMKQIDWGKPTEEVTPSNALYLSLRGKTRVVSIGGALMQRSTPGAGTRSSFVKVFFCAGKEKV